MASGRPRKFKTVEDMQKLIDAYFESCWCDEIDELGNVRKVNIRPYTVTGLCIALDTNRMSLLEYQKDDEFAYAIKRAKAKCENFAEESLFMGKNPAGVIFSLKNNYGWKDKNETELTGVNGGPIELAALTSEQRQSRINELLKERDIK
jgi:hypothetical protein